jgi:CDP-glucose 4,6-dehydratase
MTTFSEVYRGKRVMVTGLSGFKGRWLGKWLKLLGADVFGFGLEPIVGPDGRRPPLEDEFESITLDIRDRRAVADFVSAYRPDIVFHLAAQPLVRAGYDDPCGTFETNVMGTVHVLDAVRRCDRTEVFINVTSDKCYENREWSWGYRENEAMGGYDPYSASKGCSELVTAAFRRSFTDEMRPPYIASARAGNVIGGTDWSADRLLPDIARAVLSDEPIVIRRPLSVRPWQHVVEAINGYMQLGAEMLLKPGKHVEGWNFGPTDDDAVSVRDLVKIVVECWGRGVIREEAYPQGPHEARYLKLDSSKARDELKWVPLLSIRERIQWTVDWYRETATDPSAYWEVMERQIEDYQRRWNEWIETKTSESSLPAAAVSSVRTSRAA